MLFRSDHLPPFLLQETSLVVQQLRRQLTASSLHRSSPADAGETINGFFFFFQRPKQPRGHMPRACSPACQHARSLRRASAPAGRRRVQRGEGPGGRRQVRAASARHAAEGPDSAVSPERWHERGQELMKQPQGFPLGWMDGSIYSTEIVRHTYAQ